ncbi:MAG: class II aldolase/adducin family protein [Bosea sp.]|jgi:HCOMODA/2-hydroxy-3-carboxy-muconic semialdehyde decarboxylase|uniref:class II aldolase/adducin family protein n=1 Tax=Hyphomicrobiales TaxID=356 RepID=UPI0008372CB9|nr:MULTISPECIES: class II aldolase/adducin family protein [Hyphomicrobiales]MCP4561864.1 class II aldolase/adducin family protein [Bosea sp. (in: a-proteobacteria)]MCP4738175.1 class II aldolase/adducin family protein [Bosea sp. (in: a-proteobacteria)]MDX3804869.1 class II aldolase/adducin family protein [Bosea sp. (in: a-proteobacteria)]
MSVALASDAGAAEPSHRGILEDVLDDLVVSNRILAREGVLDGFGHVSARHPSEPGRYFISRSRSPALVERADLVELDLDDRPVRDTGAKLYAERVIHGAIYRARPDVMSVCHHHAPAVVAFCIAGLDIVPVCHLGAVIGQRVPVWDSRDDFGDTDLLVRTVDQAESLAAALADNWVVTMRRHGATVVGRSVRELTFRAVHLRLNAELQFRASTIAPLSPLTSGEIELSSRVNLSEDVIGRIWEYWSADI